MIELHHDVENLLLDLELLPEDIKKIEEGFNRLNGLLKGTFGSCLFLSGR